VSTEEALFDLADRMLRQVLADFGYDPTLHVGVEGMAQVRESVRAGAATTSALL
jgi:hypothetical protein